MLFFWQCSWCKYYTFTENAFFSKKKAPAGKCTHGKIFLRILLHKNGPCGKVQTRQKNIFFLFSFFSFFVSGRGIFIYHKFSHLTTIYFIRKNSYFSYTIFLLEHNRIFSHHHGVFSEHNRIFSHHNGVFSEHNRILSKHNRILSKHNEVSSKQKRAEIRGKWSDSS